VISRKWVSFNLLLDRADNSSKWTEYSYDSSISPLCITNSTFKKIFLLRVN